MVSVTQTQFPEQAMKGLPPGQDVVLDLLSWTTGPLPVIELEHVACLLFKFRYPLIGFDNSMMTAERDECRRFALQLRIAFLTMDRWNASNAAEKLAEQTAAIVFGDRPLGPTIRKEVNDYAESYVSDLWIAFQNRLFWPRQVEANNAEVEAEANHDR